MRGRRRVNRIRILIIAGLILFFFAEIAYCEVKDGVVRYEIASPDRIIDVYTTMGRATLITIPEGDVSFVAIGDDVAYSEEHLPDNNYVIVRPKEEGGTTNLTIFSTKKGVRYRTRLLYTDKLESYYNELIILPAASLEKHISFASIVKYMERGEAPDEIKGDVMFWKPGTVLNGKSASLRIDTVFYFKSPKITGLKLSINNLTDRSIYPVNGAFKLYRSEGIEIKTLGFRIPYVVKPGATDFIYVIANELIERDLRIRVGINGLGFEEYAVSSLITNTSQPKSDVSKDEIHLYEKDGKEGKL